MELYAAVLGPFSYEYKFTNGDGLSLGRAEGQIHRRYNYNCSSNHCLACCYSLASAIQFSYLLLLRISPSEFDCLHKLFNILLDYGTLV